MSADALHARWSRDAGAHEHVVFIAEGIHCAGCVSSIEKAVNALPGIDAVRVNAATARVSVDWQARLGTSLAQILAAVEGAGFRPTPLAGSAASADYRNEHRAALKRFGLASLGMMQAMMYLTALYGATDIDASMAQLMRVAGMVIVTPVLFYSGAPFLSGAWRDLRNRRLGMDVPVAFALLLAWLPSVFNTLRASGEVYFDSVGMFVFFLSAGRFVEMSIRHRSLSSAEALARSLPAEVTRIDADGSRRKVKADELVPGDRFSVPKGAVVAVDSNLAADASAQGALLDESLITGEAAAARRRAGELIRGGSVNLGAALVLVATAGVAQSTLASIVALLERAQAERPAIARLADRAASWFVASILVLAVLTALAWFWLDPRMVFPAVLAVLVVTCPCALSLATPAALAAATLRLSRLGLLVTRVDALERLAHVDTVVLDKTGTLTSGAAAINEVKLLGGQGREDVLAIAAALERDSAHPLAAAFAPHAVAAVRAGGVQEFAGEGIEGSVAGRCWRLGRRDFVEAIGRAGNLLPLVRRREADSAVYLGADAGIAAAFEVGAPLRPEARDAVQALRMQGLDVMIASGDSDATVQQAARLLGIKRARARLSPLDKTALLQELRAGGHRVFMIGDGINDGPVLAAADVSCAMGQGSAIAQAAADLLLLHESLASLPLAVATARRTLRVIRQNLAWALGYNLATVPLAACGLIPPWLAALGMSLSSLGVVLNARRLAGAERAA
ncbi:MAG: cation-translocating P-type ATPase [Pseudomonadota bacterium]